MRALILILLIRRPDCITLFFWGCLYKTFSQKENVIPSVFLVQRLKFLILAFTNLQIVGLSQQKIVPPLLIPYWLGERSDLDWCPPCGRCRPWNAQIPGVCGWTELYAQLHSWPVCRWLPLKDQLQHLPANNRKGVHSKIKLFVAAWTPTFGGMMIAWHNSLLSCAVDESSVTLQALLLWLARKMTSVSDLPGWIYFCFQPDERQDIFGMRWQVLLIVVSHRLCGRGSEAAKDE